MSYKLKNWLALCWYLFLCAVMIALVGGILLAFGLAVYDAATNGETPVEIVEQDGHKFAVVRTYRAVSMVHSPSCPCLRTNKPQ